MFIFGKLSCLFRSERADLLTLLCGVFSCIFVTLPYGVQGQVWYLIELTPNIVPSSLLLSISSYG